jgi:DNA-binding PadR family transcriptional regulator
MTLERDLFPGEYAALAFLADEPAHGYELARSWAASPIAEVCPVEQSVVYGYLRNLERRALLDWSDVRVGNRPPRRIYEVNEDGWSLLRAWLHAPVERMREVRLDLLLKLYFLERIDARAVPRLVAEQIAVCERYVEFERTRLNAAEGFERLLSESRLTAGEATLAWLTAQLAGPKEPEQPARKQQAS